MKPNNPGPKSPDSPTHRLTDSPTHRLTESPNHRITDSPTHRLTDSSIHRLNLTGLCKLASMCTMLNILIPNTSLCQTSYFEDFQSSTNCTIGYCNAEEVNCIDNWSYYDPPYSYIDDIAIFQYDCYPFSSNTLSNLDCLENGSDERALWLQSNSHQDPFPIFPDNARRYAILNPFYGHNPSSIYKLSFDFVPFPSNVASYVNVYGANTALSSTSTPVLLGSSEDDFIYSQSNGYLCSSSYIFFNDYANCSTDKSLTNYQYLVLGLSSSQTPIPPSQGSSTTYARGVLDNFNLCKILEMNVLSDCDNPCIYIQTFDQCANACIEEECKIEPIIDFYEDNEIMPFDYIDFAYTPPYSNYLECFEPPSNATHFIASASIYLAEIEASQYTCITQEVNPACQDYGVFTHQTWGPSSPPPLDRFKTLTIYSGNTLTIEASEVINFCQNGKLIIKTNARLNLYGKLTSDCPYGWEGIEVQGNGTISQQPNQSGVYGQGRLYCYPNSTIENAKTAVKLYGPDYDDAGGMIFAEGAEFLNNSRGLDFAPFHNFFPTIATQKLYQSKVRDCHFNINNGYNIPWPFIEHIKLNGVFGIGIYGTYFGNDQTIAGAFSAKQFGIGIKAINSGFSLGATAIAIEDEPCLPPCDELNRSRFYGLGIGVSVGRFGQNRPFQVYNSEFEGCFFGIANEGVSGANILFNDFIMGTTHELTGDEDQVGISMSGYQMIGAIQENSFTVTGGNADFTLGIVSNNLGEMDNAIRRNTFSGLSVGNEAFHRNAQEKDELNTGLHYICNENFSIEEFDFTIPLEGQYNFVRHQQGVLGLSTPESTGNTFSRTGDEDFGDFANYGERQIIYWQNQFEADEILEEYTDITIDDIDLGPSECDPDFCLHPCLSVEDFSDEVDTYNANLEGYADALGEEELEEAVYYLSLTHDNLNNITRYIESDTTGFNRDSLRKWYRRHAGVTGELLLAGDYFDAGLTTLAGNVIDSISIRYTLGGDQGLDIARVGRIYDILAARSIYTLTSTDVDSLNLFAGTYGASYSLARSILPLLDSIYTPRYYVPGEITPRSPASEHNVEFNRLQVKIYPNPTFSSFFVDIPEQFPDSSNFELFDLNGKVIFVTKLNQGVNSISYIDINNLGSGLYFYRIFSEEQMLSSGKIMTLK